MRNAESNLRIWFLLVLLMALVTSCASPDAVSRPVTQYEAEKWWQEIYEKSNCPTIQKTVDECEASELIRSQEIRLAAGEVVETSDVRTWNSKEAKVIRKTFDQETLAYCFLSANLSRTFDSDLDAFADSISYSYPCYWFPALSEEDAAAGAFLGHLNPDGTIGLSPFERCTQGFPLFDDPARYSQCMDREDYGSEPTW
jgi:hypothetical protein